MKRSQIKEIVKKKLLQVVILNKKKQLNEAIKQQLPSYFMRTHYQVPTQQQLQEFKNYQNLTKKQVQTGLEYNAVGKGKQTPKTDKLKLQIIQILIDAYPDNKIYKQIYKQLSSQCGN